MQYTVAMTMAVEERDQLRAELLKVHYSMITLYHAHVVDRDLMNTLDRAVSDLCNILIGDYEIKGLILVLLDNTLDEVKVQMRGLIKKVDTTTIAIAQKEVNVIKDALDNIGHLFVLYRGW